MSVDPHADRVLLGLSGGMDSVTLLRVSLTA
jgi:tRNA(Ile)-lysidine synthase TilS/MesJ